MCAPKVLVAIVQQLAAEPGSWTDFCEMRAILPTDHPLLAAASPADDPSQLVAYFMGGVPRWRQAVRALQAHHRYLSVLAARRSLRPAPPAPPPSVDDQDGAPAAMPGGEDFPPAPDPEALTCPDCQISLSTHVALAGHLGPRSMRTGTPFAGLHVRLPAVCACAILGPSSGAFAI